MGLKLDFRKTLRAIATSIQEANQARLLGGQAVAGGTLEPRVQAPAPATSKSRKRIRIGGERVKLGELAGSVGVATGAMLKDLVRSGNVKLGRTSFRIVPSEEVFTRMMAFVRGALKRALTTSERRQGVHKAPRAEIRGGLHQVPRPFCGIPGEILDEAAAQLAADGCAQMTASMQADIEAARSGEEAA